MKAVVYRGIGDIRLEDVPEPRIEEPTDAIVRLTTSAICGTDLHMVRGTLPGMQSGTILGHEGVGIVEQIGPDVRNRRVGERVVIPSTIACGTCSYCRAGYYAQCDNANPGGKEAGTAFYGGPQASGAFHGMQAEKVRVPFANVNLVPIPDGVSDDQAILISDIFPTGYFGAELAEIRPGDTVAIFGCGPVGQFAILAAKLLGACRVLAVDTIPDRLEMARLQGAEVIDFQREDPVQTIRRLTDGIGADRVIDAVGVDATRPHAGPAQAEADRQAAQFEQQVQAVSQHQARTHRAAWRAGDAPSQALSWAVEAVAKAGTVAIIGVYPMTATTFPIGQAMMKNLTLKMGNCNHLKYIPMLLRMVKTGAVDPERILTKREHLHGAIEAFRAFDQRQPGWIKVDLRMTEPRPRAEPTAAHRPSEASRPAPRAPLPTGETQEST